MHWFLYDRDIRHARVKDHYTSQYCISKVKGPLNGTLGNSSENFNP